jgi:ectoine hydroxylase-related dioxygenase (phytanoyl-CoA dioxygenase family)
MLPAEPVRAVREAVLQRLRNQRLWPAEVRQNAMPRWPEPGVTTKLVGKHHPELEALFELPQITVPIEDLFAGAAIDRAMFSRPQLLVTLPNAAEWTAANSGWHADLPRLASGGRPGVQLFVLLDDVAPKGGGTLVVSGSHLLFGDGRFIRAKDLTGLLERIPFFDQVRSGDRPKGGELEVVEMTGAAGDAWLMDLRLLHSAAPNASVKPRMMATWRYLRAELVDEIAAGFGWNPG